MSKNPCENYREQLEESMQDEICDAGLYAQIANEAPTDELRKIIVSIVGDEYGHARIQAALLGICPPKVSCPPDCPSACGDFKKDVEMAIQGELSAIARYSQLAMCAPSLDIRYLLTSILGDEYAHARIWNAMLQAKKLCEKHCEDHCEKPYEKPEKHCEKPYENPYEKSCDYGKCNYSYPQYYQQGQGQG
jgi:rubrerythrin